MGSVKFWSERKSCEVSQEQQIGEIVALWPVGARARPAQVKLIMGNGLMSDTAYRVFEYLAARNLIDLVTLNYDELPSSYVSSDGQLRLTTRADPLAVPVAFVLDPDDERCGIMVTDFRDQLATVRHVASALNILSDRQEIRTTH